MFDLICVNISKRKLDDLRRRLHFEKIFYVKNFGENKKSDGVIIKANAKDELFDKINKAKERNKFIIVLGGSNEINRASLENKHSDMLLNPEYERKKDFMHYRDSGLNHVLCKIAKENGKAIGINFNEIKKMKKKEDAEKLGRIIQNIRLCRRYGVPVVIASFAKNINEMIHSSELKTFARTLGIDKINNL